MISQGCDQIAGVVSYRVLRGHSPEVNNVGVVAESHNACPRHIEREEDLWPEGIFSLGRMSPCLFATSGQSMNKHNAKLDQPCIRSRFQARPTQQLEVDLEQAPPKH